MLNVPYYQQHTDFTCGAACLRMVFEYYGKKFEEEQLAKELNILYNEEGGCCFSEMVQVCTNHGFVAELQENATFQDLQGSLDHDIPIIVNYISPVSGGGHFAVIIGATEEKLIFHDSNPDYCGESTSIAKKAFRDNWHSGNKKFTRGALFICTQ